MGKVGANIFLTGDAIESPSLTAAQPTVEAADATLHPIQSYGYGGYTDYAQGSAVFPVIETSAESFGTGTGAATLYGLESYGSDGDRAEGFAALAGITQSTGTGGEVFPAIAFGTAMLPVIRTTADGIAWGMGEGAATLPGMEGFASDGDYAEGVAEFGLRARGYSLSAIDSIFVRINPLIGTAARDLLLLEDTLQVDDTLNALVHALLQDIIGVAGSLDTQGTRLTGTVSDNAVVSALVAVPYYLDLLESVDAGDSPSDTIFKFVEAATDIAVADSIETQSALVISLATALTVAAHSDARTHMTLAEAIQLTDTFSSEYRTYLAFAESIAVAASASESLIVTVDANDVAAVGDVADSVATLGALLEDGVSAYVSLKLGDTVIQGWITNTKDASFSEYTNFPFNSMTEVAGRYFAVAEDGLYELTGNTDNGEEIAAYVRTGLLDMGSHYIKDVKAAHIGFSADGRMLLRVRTTAKGEKREWWYELKQTQNGSVRDGRATIGRGLRAKYWQFEVANLDGNDFEIDDFQVMYNVLSRRVR